MRTAISFLLLIALASAWPVAGAPAKLIPGPKAMDAAIAKARASIDDFWRQHTKADAGVVNLALKVRVVSGKAKEALWLIEIELKGAAMSGVINTDPVTVKSVKFGQRYAFKDADIVDWTYMRNGKIVGNETLRALLDMMPPEDAAKYRKMFEKP